MQIYPKTLGPLGPEINRTTQPAAAAIEKASVQPLAPVPSGSERSDKVQISDAGRALAARGESADAAGLDPVRAARIRGRVLSGAYDTLEVVDTVARRLLDNGDL